jgi:hypothetical protein
MPDRKGLNYFNRDGRYERDLRDYRWNFADYAGEQRVGESTPLYFAKGITYDSDGRMQFDSAEDSIVRIARHFPDAQLIISLRDPLTRIASQHRWNVRRGKRSESLEEILSAELAGSSPMMLLYHNDYATHLRHVLDHFPADKVLLLVFEEWTANPQQTLFTVHDFLGVERITVALTEVPRNERPKDSVDAGSPTDVPSEISAETRAAVLEHLQPSREYVEALLRRKLPWAETNA